MSDKFNIIVDSSVIVKWYLPDEKDDYALKIQQDFTLKTIFISIPVLLFYEVNNILKSAAKSLRISQGKTYQVYEDLFQLDFTVYSSAALLKEALRLAIAFDITSYDASYIALAEYLKVPFFTADEKLVKKASSGLVKILGDYPNYS